MNQNHRFGVEIEMNTRANADRVRAALVDHQIGVSSHDAPEVRWDVRYDGSIGSGHELVSPILQGDDGLEQVMRVCAALHDLNRAGTRVWAGRACGLHIHLSNFGENDVDVLRRIARRWMNFEDTLDLMQPESRRGSTNNYCRSNLRLFAGGWSNPVADVYQNMWQRTGAVTSVNEMVDVVSPSRYLKLNLQSLQRHGTVEIRHHSASVSGTKICHWIRFLSAFFAESAQADRVWRRLPAAQTEPQVERFRKLMRGIPMATQHYLSRRIEQLNGGTFPA